MKFARQQKSFFKQNLCHKVFRSLTKQFIYIYIYFILSKNFIYILYNPLSYSVQNILWSIFNIYHSLWPRLISFLFCDSLFCVLFSVIDVFFSNKISLIFIHTNTLYSACIFLGPDIFFIIQIGIVSEHDIWIGYSIKYF